MFMLTNEQLLTAFAEINPKLAEQMNLAATARAFGDADALASAMCQMEDIEALMLFYSVKCYYQWLSEHYLSQDDYPGTGLGSEEGWAAPLPNATDCPPEVPTEPSGYTGAFAITLGCTEPATPAQVDLADVADSDYFDRSSAYLYVEPTKGTAVVDLGNFSAWYTLTSFATGTDSFVVAIKDVYGRWFYLPVSVQIDCTVEPEVDCSGFTGLTMGFPVIGAIGSEDIDGKRTNAVTVTPVGGTAPFTYEWTVDDPVEIYGADDQPAVFVKYDPLDFPLITHKVHVTVTDANGCERTASQYVAYYPMDCNAVEVDIVGDEPYQFDFGALDGITSYNEGILVDTTVGATVFAPPSNGTLVVDDAGLGLVTYTPDPGWHGEDSFEYGWHLGTDDTDAEMITGACTVTVNVGPSAPPCPDAELEVTDIFLALEDPLAVIVGSDLLMLELTTLYVTDVAQLTIVFKKASDGTVIDTPDLSLWDFTGGVLYGGVSIPDNQIVRIEITADNGCDPVELLYFHEVAWNLAPVANDDVAFCANTGTVLINLLADDYDPEGQDITIIEIDGQPFDDGANSTVVLGSSMGTVEWVDGTFVKYTPPSSTPGTFNFDYTIEDSPANPYEKLTATATITVTTKIKCTGYVTVQLDSITGGEPGARTIELTMVPTGVNASRTIAWYVNIGAGYGAADAQTTATATFTETGDNIISIEVRVTETAGNECTYSSEIDLHS